MHPWQPLGVSSTPESVTSPKLSPQPLPAERPENKWRAV